MPKRISKIVESEIIKLYKNGSGTCEISKHFGINRWTVLQYLKKHNLNPQRITRPYKNKYNIYFFSEYTKESAYWAGFIMADGNVCYTSPKYYVQIGLSEKDKDHLQKFSNAINFAGPIYDYKKGKASSISVRGKWFVNDLLNKYGITERKSLTTKYPEQLPKELHSHFIRGYFDGDGSVPKKHSATISFIGSQSMMRSIRTILHDTLKLKIRGHHSKAPLQSYKNSSVKQFVYSGDNARKIIEWLYKDSNIESRLDRKYIICKKWTNRINKVSRPHSKGHNDKISGALRGENGPSSKLKNKDAVKIRKMFFSKTGLL
ncbi:MAG: hypothetical protein KKD44_27955 [Proteobacteria bacterium]|nr:hypothetical protein [Pseudomonadota bacterium]